MSFKTSSLFPSSWSGHNEHGFCLSADGLSLTPTERDVAMRKLLRLDGGFFGPYVKPDAGEDPLTVEVVEGVEGEP